jgi:hypothetical protein
MLHRRPVRRLGCIEGWRILSLAQRVCAGAQKMKRGLGDLFDESVGPRCIVAWRNKPGGGRKGGGSHQAYVGTTRADAPLLPTIGAGRDVSAIISAMTPYFTKMFDAARAGEPTPEPEWGDEFCASPEQA